MKKRCSKCGYHNTDKKHSAVKLSDGLIVDQTKQRIVCYRVDAPDVELCPKCKAVL